MTFDTEIIRDGEMLRGPLRAPTQMLAEQEYAGHTSVHDDETAAELGLAGAPIEGPTHFSQIDPLAVERWGQVWFERGCVSSHFQFSEVKENTQGRIDFAKALGLKQMIIASLGMPKGATIAEWTRAAEEMNLLGEKTKKAGIQLGFHNHDGEFEEVDGVLIFDALMKAFDPQLVKNQFQVSVIRLGFAAPPLFEKYAGRFISLHLMDWSAAEKRLVPVGQGVVDWKALFAAAKKGGVKNYFVEMGMDALKESYTYLHELQVRGRRQPACCASAVLCPALRRITS